MNKARVLIADDSKFFQKYIKTLVESLGFDVIETVGDGVEAIEALKEKDVNLIFLDINMPRMTGIEAVEEIINEYPHSTVIMMTSVSDILIVQKCMDLGAANYIVKNSSEEEMREIITQTWELYGDAE
ncbi:MAG: response regulator [Tissierellales bacterium]|jgi:DNA-binding NarL/FixJ family response regulator|nr:response regulator [Tissierellales bacterium]